MKRLAALILAAGLLLCACGEKASLEIQISEGTVTQTGLVYVITLIGKGDLTVDPSYYLEQNVGGAWVKVDGAQITGGETDTIDEPQALMFVLDWSEQCGELPGGLYKLNKTVTLDGEAVKLTADFQIVTGAE